MTGIRWHLAVAVALAGAACGGTTGGAILSIPFEAGGVARDAAPDAPMTIVTPQIPVTGTKGEETSWTITLTSAYLNTGPFYFNLDSPSSREFRSGVVIMEVLQQWAVDALDPTLYAVPGGVMGNSGTAISVEIDFLPPLTQEIDLSPPALAVPQLSDNDAYDVEGYVAGTAVGTVKGATVSIPFAGPIDITSGLPEQFNSILSLQRVAGAVCNLDFTSDRQTLEFRIDPTHWFDSTDFSQLLSTTPSSKGVYTWTETDTFFQDLLQGLQTETGVYNFQLAPTGG